MIGHSFQVSSSQRIAKVDKRKPSSDYLLLILANLIWGSTDVAAKFALAEMSPQTLAWTRFTIALFAFLPWMVLRRAEIPRTLRGLLPFLALGACGFFLNYVLHYHGLRLAPASHATALRVSEALVIVVLSAVLLGERVGRRAAFGLVTGTAGVLMVLDIDFYDLSLFNKGYRLGDFFIICGIFVEGLYTIIGKRVLVKSSPLTATALACAFGWLMLSISSGPEVYDLLKNPPSLSALLACAFLGLFASGLGYLIWYQVLARRESHRVGITIVIQPIVGIPLATLVFGDIIKPIFLAGATLIVLGVYLALGPAPGEGHGSGSSLGQAMSK